MLKLLREFAQRLATVVNIVGRCGELGLVWPAVAVEFPAPLLVRQLGDLHPKWKGCSAEDNDLESSEGAKENSGLWKDF